MEQSEWKTGHELGSKSLWVQCQYFELYHIGNEEHCKQVFEQERDMLKASNKKKINMTAIVR